MQALLFEPSNRGKPMNRLSVGRRTQIINCLVEGNSIRSTERMTDTYRDTIMRLMVAAYKQGTKDGGSPTP